MATYWNRLKARNYSKFDSKLSNGPAEMKEMAERLSHHRWQVDSSRLKARNCSKFNSKLFKGPAALELCSLATGGTQEIAEIAEMSHHRWRLLNTD